MLKEYREAIRQIKELCETDTENSHVSYLVIDICDKLIVKPRKRAT